MAAGPSIGGDATRCITCRIFCHYNVVRWATTATVQERKGLFFMGIMCPECNQLEWQVLYTERKPGAISRRRQCKNCGFRMTTAERPVNIPQPNSISIGRVLQSSEFSPVRPSGQ
ncbi:NrdR family transcriptional regulator [Rubinisphaera brasiliensis]|uniref:NrdR family transcriptional regulator n=1 Tax=Rubinisphaera brasiliensis TaxID=119 RepID=UPI0036F2FB9F